MGRLEDNAGGGEDDVQDDKGHRSSVGFYIGTGEKGKNRTPETFLPDTHILHPLRFERTTLQHYITWLPLRKLSMYHR